MTGDDKTMQFDPIRATLVATDDELAELAAPKTEAGDGVQLHPTAAGIVALLASPCRSVAIERFDRGLVSPLFVAFDERGRAVLTEGAGHDRLAMTATHLELLPALLSQALRLHAGLSAGDRQEVTATAAQIQAALAGAEGAEARHDTGAADAEPGPAGQAAAGPEPTGSLAAAEQDRAAVLGAMTHGWRASASWAGADIDRSVTVMSAGDRGLWHVDRGPADHAPLPIGPDDRVTLRPVTAAQARSLLGDVVTGHTRIRRRSVSGRGMRDADREGPGSKGGAERAHFDGPGQG